MSDKQTDRDDIFMPLTGPQGWFFAMDFSNPHYCNASRLLVAPPDINPTLMELAIKQLLIYHEELRIRFIHDKFSWRQLITDFDHKVPFSQLDLSTLPLAEQRTAIETISEQFQSSLNICTGPIFQVILFNLRNAESGRLLVIVHHLIADEFSFQIILNDLLLAYKQLSSGENVQLPSRTTSLREYTNRVIQYIESDEFEKEANFWLNMPWAKVVPLPADYPEGKGNNTNETTRYIELSLTSEETQFLLHLVPSTYKVQVQDILITSLIQAFYQWTGIPVLQISIVLNGRMISIPYLKDVDLTRTIGFISCGTELLVLEIEENQALEYQLRSVSEQLRRMPHQGTSCQWVRYLCKDTKIMQKIHSLPRHEVVFNYHGRKKRSVSSSMPLFQRAEEEIGKSQDSQNNRMALLICQAIVINDQFMMAWEYSGSVHSHNTIENLAQSYMKALRNFIGEARNIKPK